MSKTKRLSFNELRRDEDGLGWPLELQLPLGTKFTLSKELLRKDGKFLRLAVVKGGCDKCFFWVPGQCRASLLRHESGLDLICKYNEREDNEEVCFRKIK